jgi:hypothetical protein
MACSVIQASIYRTSPAESFAEEYHYRPRFTTMKAGALLLRARAPAWAFSRPSAGRTASGLAVLRPANLLSFNRLPALGNIPDRGEAAGVIDQYPGYWEDTSVVSKPGNTGCTCLDVSVMGCRCLPEGSDQTSNGCFIDFLIPTGQKRS